MADTNWLTEWLDEEFCDEYFAKYQKNSNVYWKVNFVDYYPELANVKYTEYDCGEVNK